MKTNNLFLLYLLTAAYLYSQAANGLQNFAISESRILDRPLGRWNGLYFIPSAEESATVANLQIFDGTGKEPRIIRYEIPGAVRVVFHDATALGSAIIVAADIWEVGGIRASTIAAFDEKGQVLWMRRTNPFRAKFLTVASDSTIWVFGQNIADSLNGLAQDHDTLQVYRSDGQLLRTHAKASLYGTQRLIRTDDSSKLGRSFLGSYQDRVVLLLANYQKWFEFSLDGRLLSSSNIPAPTETIGTKEYPMKLFGTALTASGRLLANFRSSQRWFFELDRKQQKWVPITDLNPSRHVALWGASGNQVLVSVDGPKGDWAYSWVTVQ